MNAKPTTLGDLLDRQGWSILELARQAGISDTPIDREIRGRATTEEIRGKIAAALQKAGAISSPEDIAWMKPARSSLLQREAVASASEQSLSRLCIKLNWSIPELAERAGISRTPIYTEIRGRATTEEIRGKIAAALQKAGAISSPEDIAWMKPARSQSFKRDEASASEPTLVSLCSKLNWSIVELAERAGVSRHTIYKELRGEPTTQGIRDQIAGAFQEVGVISSRDDIAWSTPAGIYGIPPKNGSLITIKLQPQQVVYVEKKKGDGYSQFFESLYSKYGKQILVRDPLKTKRSRHSLGPRKDIHCMLSGDIVSAIKEKDHEVQAFFDYLLRIAMAQESGEGKDVLPQ